MRISSGRIVLAVIAGYIANAVLVGLTEAVFVKHLNSSGYFIVDLGIQIAITIMAGCLCCLIAKESRTSAAIGMAVLGLIIGTASLFVSWNTEPHWYGIALLFVYAPCVWTGYSLVVRNEK